MQRFWCRAILALVLTASLVGCGSGGDDSAPTEGAATPEEQFCAAWLALGPAPSVNDAEAAVVWADGVEALLAAAPSRHRPAIEQMSRTAARFIEVGDRAKWSADGFSALSSRQQEDMATQADVLSLFFTGPVAVYAHEVCPGATDPAFEIRCIGFRAFLPTSQGGEGGLVVEPAAGDPPAAPATTDAVVAAAEDRRASVSGAVEVRHVDDDDVLLVSYLDDQGRSVQLEEYERSGEGWVPVTTSRCGLTP